MRFPAELTGLFIIMRECFVDGETAADNLTDLFLARARFIEREYGYPKGAYFDKTVPELEKILNIPAGSEINLWFEDDLFCQVNFWFVCAQLARRTVARQVFLVRPDEAHPYSFGEMSRAALLEAYRNKKTVPPADLMAFGHLWKAYQHHATGVMRDLADSLKGEYPFVNEALNAHLQRFPENGEPGRPERVIMEIMREKNTEDFREIFQEFSRREGIYGFGDLQVSNLCEKIKWR